MLSFDCKNIINDKNIRTSYSNDYLLPFSSTNRSELVNTVLLPPQFLQIKILPFFAHMQKTESCLRRLQPPVDSSALFCAVLVVISYLIAVIMSE